jgi:hypothetical protein
MIARDAESVRRGERSKVSFAIGEFVDWPCQRRFQSPRSRTPSAPPKSESCSEWKSRTMATSSHSGSFISPTPCRCRRICERTAGEFHGLGVLWIVGAQFHAALGLFDHIKSIPFCELETRQKLLRQDGTCRIADLLDLKDIAFGARGARPFGHGFTSHAIQIV